jgi:hypothetical protein
MTQARFKELFEEISLCDFWRYIYYYQAATDMYYYNRGYYYYFEHNNYPRVFNICNNPYEKNSEPYKDFEAGWNKAFAEDELAYALSPSTR